MPEFPTVRSIPTPALMPAARSSAARPCFERVYEEHAMRMQRIAVKNFQLPEDEARSLVHDIFMAYLADPTAIRGSLRPYFVGAICNASRAYWRKFGRHAPLVAAEMCEEESDREKKDLTLDLASVISQLAPLCQNAIRQFYFEGGSCDEIAASLGTSRQHIHQILHSCRARIRALLKARANHGAE